MAALKCIVFCMVVMFALVMSSPIPEPGGFGGKHEHYIIHVPYEVHTVHHHHVKKVPVYVKSHHHHVYESHHGWD